MEKKLHHLLRSHYGPVNQKIKHFINRWDWQDSSAACFQRCGWLHFYGWNWRPPLKGRFSNITKTSCITCSLHHSLMFSYIHEGKRNRYESSVFFNPLKRPFVHWKPVKKGFLNNNRLQVIKAAVLFPHQSKYFGYWKYSECLKTKEGFIS